MKNTKTKKNRDIADAVLFVDKLDNDNKKLNLGYFEDWLKPMTKNILYAKQHPEFKDLTDDLLLYSDEELINFLNSKEEVFKLNLLKYISGISNEYFVEEDRHKCELYQDLYNKCKNANQNHPEAATKNHTLSNKTLPKIDKEKFDAKWIFDTYNNVVFECSEACFNSWLKDGIEHPETIEYILKGRQGKPAIAQLRKFIEKITGDAENTKDTYYKTVFGLEIKTAQLKTATNLNSTFQKLKNYKLPNKPAK